MIKNGMRAIHPGEILYEEFLVPFGMTAHALSKALHVAPARINEIVRKERGITAETALRLSRYFGTTAQFWLNLQLAYDLRVTEKKALQKIEAEIEPREDHLEVA